MEADFDDVSRYRDWLQDKLQLEPTDPHHSGLVEAFTLAAAEGSDDPLRLELIVGNWVIRDGDLEIFETIKDTVLALAGAKFVFGNLGAAGVTAMAFSLIGLLRKAYAKGAKISPEQAEILASLRAVGRPVSVPHLLDELTLSGALEWNEPTIMRTLISLTAVPSHSGSIKIVESFPDNTWALADV